MSDIPTLHCSYVANGEILVDADLDEKPKVKAFPKVDVQTCLLAELILLAEAEAQIRGMELPKEPAAFLKMSIPLDSLSVVDILCAVEPIIGFQLKDGVVRTGGYSSIEAAIDHLMPRIEKAWAKKHGADA
jgi:hypothetical protein